MEQRILRVMFNKAGGNASKNSLSSRISIPKKWLNIMGVTKECREVLMSFDGNKIIIENGGSNDVQK